MGEPVVNEQIRYALDAEESLRRANLAAVGGNADVSVAHATIAAASAVLASLPRELWTAVATRRALEAEGQLRRGQTLTDPGESRPPARPVLVRDDDGGVNGG